MPRVVRPITGIRMLNPNRYPFIVPRKDINQSK